MLVAAWCIIEFSLEAPPACARSTHEGTTSEGAPRTAVGFKADLTSTTSPPAPPLVPPLSGALSDTSYAERAQTVKGGVLWMRSTARLCTINARGDDERGSTHRRRIQGGPRINYVAACSSAFPSAVRRSKTVTQ